MESFSPEEMSNDDLARTLSQMRDDMAALQRTLQDRAMLLDLVEQAESAGFDTSEQTAAELLEFIQTEMDVDEETVVALQDAADGFLQSVDADALDATSAEAMADWLEETAGEEDEGEGEDTAAEETTENEGEGGENPTTMQDLEEVKSVVGEVAQHLGDLKDMLQAREDQREESLEELERRLSQIEDEPVERSLTGANETEFVSGTESDDDEDAAPSSAELGV